MNCKETEAKIKKILGLDIGTASIGWAFVLEDEFGEKESEIKRLGVRIIPMGNEQQEFESGNAITKNADRRTKRGVRRNNHRYKLRKRLLVLKLTKMGLYPFSKYGNKLEIEVNKGDNVNSLIYDLRANALQEKLTLQEIGRIFYQLNQKRGYKSNRKANIDDEKENDADSYLGKIDTLDDYLTQNNFTIGEYFSQEFKTSNFIKTKENVFLRKRFLEEFDKIWKFQKQFYPDILTDENYDEVRNKIIYYQRRLKSQKHLVSNCRFEYQHKVAPKSSPLFQEYKVWLDINNLRVDDKFGDSNELTIEQKIELHNLLQNKKELTANTILKHFNYSVSDGFNLNFDKLQGNQTLVTFKNNFKKNKIERDDLLNFDPLIKGFEKQPFYHLWHLLYSIEQPEHLVRALKKNFNFTNEEAKVVSKISFKTDHCSLSSRAIRKLIPYLKTGLMYSEACDALRENSDGKNQQYYHSDLNRENENADKETGEIIFQDPELVKPNSLRNPVVEKVVNQVVNLINAIIYSSDLGRPDEIRVELARELKMNIKKRKKIFKNNNERNRENILYEKRIREECEVRVVSRNDIMKYRMWLETNMTSIYTGKPIKLSDVFNNALYDVEHIIPRSRYFDDSFNNKTLCESNINKEKGDMTAFDYMKSKREQEFHDYIERINNNKKFGWNKKKYLLMSETKIPVDFIERQLKETQYISKEVLKILKGAANNVTSTTGSVTDFLRYTWGINNILQELNIDKYRSINETELVENKQGRKEERIKNWSKREDHRHHAIDALVTAFTKQSHIHKLNRLNQFVRNQTDLKAKARDIAPPINNLTEKVKEKTDEILISFKKNNKVVSKKMNKIKGIEKEQTTWVPRGALHRDFIYGKVKIPQKIKLSTRFNSVDKIINKKIKEVLIKRLNENDNDPKKAFKGLAKNPIYVNDNKGHAITEVEIFSETYAIRKKLNIDFKQADKIIDKKIKTIVKERLAQNNNNPKEAFKDLENNPIWQNKEKGVPLKSVRIFDHGKDLHPLHENEKGESIDYVYLRNNHHIAIYKNDKEQLEEEVVSLWEAVERRRPENNLPIINKEPKDGREFVTSLEINELFVMNLDPNEVDFTNPMNFPLISKHLYRVQKLSSKYYCFRHHVETKITKEQFPFYIRITGFGNGKGGWKTFNPIKVRIDNLNRIVKIGE